jgi:REP element-mobilizing transposase RayT
MARKPRVEVAGGIYHVWARRVDRWTLFVDGDDYQAYVSLLAETVERFDWVLLSFCLMPNHVHHMIELRAPNLGKGMHHLHRTYVRRFNDRHARHGRLFEHRYKVRPVADEVYFLTLASYIEQNPVNARLCDKPEDWRWSSRGIAANGATPRWLADGTLTRYRRELKDATWNRL